MMEETVLLKAFKYYDLDNSGFCNPENFMKSLIKVGINSVNEENLQKTIENCNKKYLGIQN